MGIPENIDALLIKYNINQDCLARIAGVAPSAITRWRQGSWPRKKAIEKICEHFSLKEDDILSDSYGLAAKEHGGTNVLPKGAIHPICDATAWAPIRGRVHAGKPAEPEEVKELAALPATILDAHPNAYFLQVEGDCMDKVYPEGCLILVDPEREPSNGSIAAVSIDGHDAVMRRLLRTPSTMVLSPESFNGEHEDIIITADSGHTVQLIGTVVWFQASKEME